jgi:hypothetical protein
MKTMGFKTLALKTLTAIYSRSENLEDEPEEEDNKDEKPLIFGKVN